MSDRGGPYRAADGPHDRACPRCGNTRPLDKDVIRDIPVEPCPRCEGLWVPLASYLRVRRDLDVQSQLAEALGSGERYEEDRVEYLCCPDCARRMARTNFARRSGIIVDSCPTHGVWFDRGELGLAVSFLIDHAGEPIEPIAAPVRDPALRLHDPAPILWKERPASKVAHAIEVILELLAKLR